MFRNCLLYTSGRELTKELTEQYGHRAVLEAARKVEEQLRGAIRQQILAEEKPAVFLDTSGLSDQKDGLPVKPVSYTHLYLWQQTAYGLCMIQLLAAGFRNGAASF